jgi:hypothetical protein
MVTITNRYMQIRLSIIPVMEKFLGGDLRFLGQRREIAC